MLQTPCGVKGYLYNKITEPQTSAMLVLRNPSPEAYFRFFQTKLFSSFLGNAGLPVAPRGLEHLGLHPRTTVS